MSHFMSVHERGHAPATAANVEISVRRQAQVQNLHLGMHIQPSEEAARGGLNREFLSNANGGKRATELLKDQEKT